MSKRITKTDAPTLNDLFSLLADYDDSESQYPVKLEDAYDLSSLPTYGGESPEDTLGVYSWDADRRLVFDCNGDVVIEPRPMADLVGAELNRLTGGHVVAQDGDGPNEVWIEDEQGGGTYRADAALAALRGLRSEGDVDRDLLWSALESAEL